MNALDRFKILAHRVRYGSFSKMKYFAHEIKEETGRSEFLTILDMCFCILKYGIGYQEYRGYSFYNKRAALRKTFMTVNHNVAFTRLTCNSELYDTLGDKAQFLEIYKDFADRDWLDTRKWTLDSFQEFCRKHESFFIKPMDDSGGNGIQKINVSEINTNDFFDRLSADTEDYIIEEPIVQHHELNRLFPSSVNTLRIVTLIKDGKAKHLYSALRCGQGDSIVDNAGSGGVYTLIPDDGVCVYPFYDEKKGLTYEAHPTTGVEIRGFKIPMYKEALDMVLKAALVQPEMGYVGWDVAITENGPTLVEGNIVPGYDMAQNSNWHPDGKGILPLMEEAWGGKIPR